MRYLCQLFYKSGRVLSPKLSNNPRLHQQARGSFFPFIYKTLPLENRTTVFIGDAYNQHNAYWIYMVAVMYTMVFFKVRLKTIVGVQCIITVFCYDKVRFIIVKSKKTKTYIYIYIP